MLFSQLFPRKKKKKKSTSSIRKVSFSCLGRKGRGGGGLRVKGELGGGQGEGREAIGIELRTADERGCHSHLLLLLLLPDTDGHLAQRSMTPVCDD